MPINLTAPSVSTSSVLIADTSNAAGGSPDAITQGLTRVTINGVLKPVNAALEIQSTSSALLLPRMTTAQIAAIPVVTDGMMVYNTSTASLNVRQGGVFGLPMSNVLLATGTLTPLQINNMDIVHAPIQIMPAPGANLTYVIHSFFISSTRTVDYTIGMATNFWIASGSQNTYNDNISNATSVDFLTVAVAGSGGGRGQLLVGGSAANSSRSYTALVNNPLYLTCANPIGGGNGTVQWSLLYSVVGIF